MENIAYIAIGSNIDDREHYLLSSIKTINEHQKIDVILSSSIYQTDPVGYEDQDRFLNMVIKVKTNLSPFDLLSYLQKVEIEYGRKREIKWGPRTLDLDILLYNNENIETEDLIIPHPRMTERAFVMVPLLEIGVEGEIPYIGMPLSKQINELRDREGVLVWKRKNGEGVFEHSES